MIIGGVKGGACNHWGSEGGEACDHWGSEGEGHVTSGQGREQEGLTARRQCKEALSSTAVDWL